MLKQCVLRYNELTLDLTVAPLYTIYVRQYTYTTARNDIEKYAGHWGAAVECYAKPDALISDSVLFQ